MASNDQPAATTASESIYPYSGMCAYCERERDDLFWHAQDEAFYCADVFRCEARVAITVQRRYRKECLGLDR